MSRLWNVGLALGGLGVVAFAIDRIGAAAVMREIQMMRVGLPIVLTLTLIRLFLQTTSWSLALQKKGIKAPAPELLFVRMASQAVGYLSILGPVASEPMKIDLIRTRYSGASVEAVATATLADTGVTWFTSAVVSIIGCVTAGMILSTHNAHNAALIVGAGFVLALYFFSRQASLIARLGQKLGGRAPAWLLKAGRIDASIRQFGVEQPRTMRKMLLLGFASQALTIAEVVAIFYCLGMAIDPSRMLGLEAANRLTKLASGWMPARIGADEGGAVTAFIAFGLPAASGLTLALVRRARDLLTAAAGLIWLAMRRRMPSRAI